MKVVIAGSSGLIGTALVAAMRRDGHHVVRVVRRPAAAAVEYVRDTARAVQVQQALRGPEDGVN
uniref:NAD-dependent epimerase/dehydratase family protein n=1 Tax=Nocardia cyriacigeorgica TaxID=135487 RepID=UPI002453F37B